MHPGGIVAFHEIDDADDFAALPEVPLWKQANDWLMSALRSLLPNPDVPGWPVDCFSQHLGAIYPGGAGLIGWLARMGIKHRDCQSVSLRIVHRQKERSRCDGRSDERHRTQ
jgi:hypothetical protein